MLNLKANGHWGRAKGWRDFLKITCLIPPLKGASSQRIGATQCDVSMKLLEKYLDKEHENVLPNGNDSHQRDYGYESSILGTYPPTTPLGLTLTQPKPNESLDLSQGARSQKPGLNSHSVGEGQGTFCIRKRIKEHFWIPGFPQITLDLTFRI